MGLIHAFDASIPPMDAPRGMKAAFGYLGDEGRTPHIWTEQEWDRFGDLEQLGIWVPDYTESPAEQGTLAVIAAVARGFREGRGILGDFEAITDPAWIGEWGLQVRNHGFVPVAYESPSVLQANPLLDGVILAQPGDPAAVSEGLLIIGRQYRWNEPAGATLVDLDVLDSSAAHLLGRGPRA